MLARALSNKELAQEINISEGSAKIYVHQTLVALGFTSRLEVAVWANQHMEALKSGMLSRLEVFAWEATREKPTP